MWYWNIYVCTALPVWKFYVVIYLTFIYRYFLLKLRILYLIGCFIPLRRDNIGELMFGQSLRRNYTFMQMHTHTHLHLHRFIFVREIQICDLFIIQIYWYGSFCISRSAITRTHRVESLQWRHNGRNGVSNHQPHECLLSRLFRRISKKTSKLCVTGLCEGKSPVTEEFPSQRSSNAEFFFPFDDVIMT